MKKNKHYFLRMAILKTMATGVFYLFIPIFAEIYHSAFTNAIERYWGYSVLGASIMILGNIVLLVRAWTLAFDSDVRKRYFEGD
jgi:hypothetical protein